MPKSVIAVDAGNTRTKVSLFRGMECIESGCSVPDDVGLIYDIVSSACPDGAVCGMVGKSLSPRYLQTLKDMTGGHLLVVTAETRLPIGIDYASRHTLGIDRVAAAAGAADRFPGTASLVVDAGTAMTLDIIDTDGVFRGGNISPGISLRFKSLHQFTKALPLVGLSGASPTFGHDTETAIRSGVLGGIRSEITDAFLNAQSLYGAKRILLTGGDSDIILDLLNLTPDTVCVDKNIVGRGLVSIYNFNNQ